jgi:hypothetical protein
LDQHQLYKKWIFCNDGSACNSSALVTHRRRASTSFPMSLGSEDFFACNFWHLTNAHLASCWLSSLRHSICLLIWYGASFVFAPCFWQWELMVVSIFCFYFTVMEQQPWC